MRRASTSRNLLTRTETGTRLVRTLEHSTMADARDWAEYDMDGDQKLDFDEFKDW